jgi:hypothetical protein
MQGIVLRTPTAQNVTGELMAAAEQERTIAVPFGND